MNPQGLVPLLVVGERRIAQSLAIIEYLEERHPLPPLLPEGAEERAWVRSIALAIISGTARPSPPRLAKYSSCSSVELSAAISSCFNRLMT